MKIALMGATGMVGSRIAFEAASRGHQVTAISRSGRAPVEDSDLVTGVVADADDSARVAEVVAGHDVVAAALVPPRDGQDPREPFTRLYDNFLRGVRDSGVPRVLIVGGAGSMLVGPGLILAETPDFPPAYKPEALAHHDLLSKLRADRSGLDWTYVSPAAEFGPGLRTGAFRVGEDRLLTDAQGRSSLSAEDYAIAFVDEIESGAHHRTRISVAPPE